VVTFGRENAVTIYALTMAVAIGVSLTLAYQLQRMWLILPVVILAVYGFFIVQYFRKHLHSRDLVTANVNTIYLAMAFGVAFTVCLMV